MPGKLATMELDGANLATQNSPNHSGQQNSKGQCSIAEFYENKTIFITGGTGFMGKVLLEKLLRSCPGISKIYLLIRCKRGQGSRERLQQLLNSPVSFYFHKLKK